MVTIFFYDFANRLHRRWWCWELSHISNCTLLHNTWQFESGHDNSPPRCFGCKLCAASSVKRTTYVPLRIKLRSIKRLAFTRRRSAVVKVFPVAFGLLSRMTPATASCEIADKKKGLHAGQMSRIICECVMVVEHSFGHLSNDRIWHRLYANPFPKPPPVMNDFSTMLSCFWLAAIHPPRKSSRS